jgi:hypothetical protein
VGTRTSSRRGFRTAVSGGLVTGFVLMIFALTISPAAAVQDPTRPDARVTHGPSCRPGGLVVEVTAGSAPYFVRLATTRRPAGEDEATLAPGATVTLRTGEVAWGERIDGRLEYTAGDGSGTTYVDELDTYSFTRPTHEDCDAVNALAATGASPPTWSATDTSVASGEPDVSTTASGSSSGTSAGERVAVPAGTDSGSPSAARPVAAGGTVTLVPLISAAAALVATVAGLVSVAGRQRALGQGRLLRRA